MKVWIGAVIMLMGGVSAGFAATWLEFRDIQEYFEPRSRAKTGMPMPADADAPVGPLAVVVGGTTFDFGTMDHNQSNKRSFVIRNEGNKPLKVEWNGESCGMCIENKHSFSPTVVEPGGQCEIIVTYAAKKLVTNFSESAYLKTNDPRASSLQLQITGTVTLALKLDPESVTLGTILTTEPTTATAKLFGFQNARLELVKHELSDPSASGLIEVTSRPLSAEAITAEKHARAGLEIQFQFKAGLPIGPLAQTVKLTAVTDAEHVIELPIRGTVVGDISMSGRGFDAASATWSLGIAKSAEGLQRDLFVLIKGPLREEVRITAGEVDPADVMKVTIGERVVLSTGKAVKVPIRISIPVGTAPISRLGTLQSKAARLVLETTHPTAKSIPLTVRFAIDG